MSALLPKLFAASSSIKSAPRSATIITAAYAYASDVMAERAMDDPAQDSFHAFLNRRHL